MSATRPQTRAEQFLTEESESLSQLLYSKPYVALDEVRQQRVLASAKRALKDRIFYEPPPGECFNCGRVISENQVQCWHCHESTHPTAKERWLEKNNRLHPSEVLL
jgi:hypothetical protein